MYACSEKNKLHTDGDDDKFIAFKKALFDIKYRN